jgi:hypothetical protein
LARAGRAKQSGEVEAPDNRTPVDFDPLGPRVGPHEPRTARDD